MQMSQMSLCLIILVCICLSRGQLEVAHESDMADGKSKVGKGIAVIHSRLVFLARKRGLFI